MEDYSHVELILSVLGSLLDSTGAVLEMAGNPEPSFEASTPPGLILTPEAHALIVTDPTTLLGAMLCVLVRDPGGGFSDGVKSGV